MSWVLSCALLSAGCAITEGFACNDGSKPPPPGSPCQIVTTWQKRIAYAADPTRGGQMNPGLAGRLYLFGPHIDTPMTGQGALKVEMFDDTQGPATAKVEEWTLDSATVDRLLRRDIIGWGYTLFLPSGTWKPEMSKIRLRTCYQPKTGTPLYAESVVTLADTNGVMHEEYKQVSLAPPMPAR
jgi:hypothetical protein